MKYGNISNLTYNIQIIKNQTQLDIAKHPNFSIPNLNFHINQNRSRLFPIKLILYSCATLPADSTRCVCASYHNSLFQFSISTKTVPRDSLPCVHTSPVLTRRSTANKLFPTASITNKYSYLADYLALRRNFLSGKADLGRPGARLSLAPRINPIFKSLAALCAPSSGVIL